MSEQKICRFRMFKIVEIVVKTISYLIFIKFTRNAKTFYSNFKYRNILIIIKVKVLSMQQFNLVYNILNSPLCCFLSINGL